MFLVEKAVVVYKSKKQKLFLSSIVEVEYITWSIAIKIEIKMRKMIPNFERFGASNIDGILC